MRLIVSLAVLGCFSFGCIQHYAPQLRRGRLAGGDEPYVSPHLTLTNDAAFVVRAGGSTQDAVGARTSTDVWAAELEIQLQRAGYIVRDRQLAEVRLRQATKIDDYAKLAHDLGIDFIMEIVQVRDGRAPAIENLPVENGRLKTTDHVANQHYWDAHQWEVTTDIIRVRDNTRVGRIVGLANTYSVAQVHGLWPFAPLQPDSYVKSFHPADLIYEVRATAEKVPGVVCERSCGFTQPEVPIRVALADAIRQLSTLPKQ